VAPKEGLLAVLTWGPVGSLASYRGRREGATTRQASGWIEASSNAGNGREVADGLPDVAGPPPVVDVTPPCEGDGMAIPALTRLTEAAREIVAKDRTGWSGAARSALVLELLEAEEALHAAALRCTGEWDAMSAWAEDGALTASSWLSHRAPVTTATARELVRDARLVQRNQATAKALSVGEISTAHVSAAARAACHVEDLYGDHEEGIVDAARVTSPDEFRTVITHWRSMAENLVGKEPTAARFERRHLHISPVLDSMTRLDGWIDAEAGTLLASALDALEPPDPSDGPEPPRTLSQRRADGLVRLVSGTRARRAEVAIVMDIDTVQGRSPADLTHARCDLLGGEPIDYSTAVRMACDAAVTRVITKGANTILDLGRATPVVSAAQRKALAIRDGGCVEPGCTAPPEWCDSHHKWHWIRGGPTDLWNLELRCRRHHIKAHRQDQRGPPSSN